MTIKEIIDRERWEPGDHGLAPMPSVEHNAALKRITDAVLEDEAALMRQVKLWSTACKDAEQRIAELEKTINQLSKADASLRAQNEAQERNAVASAKRIAELEEALDVRDMKLSDISNACESAGCLADEAMDEFIFKQAALIAELEAQLHELIEALKTVIIACESSRIVENGIGGMTLEAQAARSYYARVPVILIDKARDVYEKHNGGDA